MVHIRSGSYSLLMAILFCVPSPGLSYEGYYAGGVLKMNTFKYLRNLGIFHLKIKRKWNPPKQLEIPDNPSENINPFRPCNPRIPIHEYYLGTTTDEMFFDPAKKEARKDSCLYEGGIPITTCQYLEIIPYDDELLMCFCATDNTNPTPFVFGFNGTHCLGEIGSVCDPDKLPCNGELVCEDGGSLYEFDLNLMLGRCGGLDGAIERSFVGLEVKFTEEKYLKYALEREADSTNLKRELYMTASAPRVGRTCNADLYARDAKNVLSIVKKLNDSTFPKDLEAMITYLTPSDDAYYEQANDYFFVKAEHSEVQECLDQFPRMWCQPPNQTYLSGQCVCSNFGAYFHYVEVDGSCVAKRGSICTTVRGSGDFLCEPGVTCEPIGINATFFYMPNPLSDLEIKVCGGLPSLSHTENFTLEGKSSVLGSGSPERHLAWTFLCLTTFPLVFRSLNFLKNFLFG